MGLPTLVPGFHLLFQEREALGRTLDLQIDVVMPGES